MALQILPFQNSINTCYLLKDRGSVLVDAAYSGCEKSFTEWLAKHRISPGEISLIIATHGDFDHVGGASELKKLTGAKIVMHEKDKHLLEKGIFHWPNGTTPWGRLSRAMLKPMVKAKTECPSEKVDLVINDQGLSLKEYGIEGEIVYTPGHTYGSISVVLDSGDAFVGCMAHNRLPFVLRPKLPIYALDMEMLKESWGKVISKGAQTIWPGHGRSFPLNKILKYLN